MFWTIFTWHNLMVLAADFQAHFSCKYHQFMSTEGEDRAKLTLYQKWMNFRSMWSFSRGREEGREWWHSQQFLPYDFFYSFDMESSNSDFTSNRDRSISISSVRHFKISLVSWNVQIFKNQMTKTSCSLNVFGI